MNSKGKIEKVIAKKEAEILEYENNIREAKIYIQALQDALRMLPRGDTIGEQEIEFRSGSNASKVYELLQKINRPMHIKDIVVGLGLPFNKKNRSLIRGAISPYVKAGRVFNRPAPNTYWLTEKEDKSTEQYKEDKDKI